MRRLTLNRERARLALRLVFVAAGAAFISSTVAQPPAESNSGENQTPPPWEETVNTINSSSIVFISFSGMRENGLRDNKTGTGFIVSSEGHVITCSHVVPPKSEYTEFAVTGVVGARFGPEYPLDDVVDRVEQLDLVLLKLPPAASPWRSVQAITRAKAQAQILALGFPLDQNLLGVPGAITSLHGKAGRWVTNSALNKGMSGGPVFDRTGAVVAIVAAGREDAQQINELIPISFATTLLLESGSSVVTKQNKAVQRSAEELAKAAADLEKSRAALAAKQLSSKQSAHVDDLFEKGEKAKAEWYGLYNSYIELNRTKPGPKSTSDRQEIINDMRHTVKHFDTVSDRLVSLAH